MKHARSVTAPHGEPRLVIIAVVKHNAPNAPKAPARNPHCAVAKWAPAKLKLSPLIFIITNEADHSDEVDDMSRLVEWAVDAKAACGGEDCIIGAGLLPGHCVGMALDNNYRFLSSFGEEPVWGDIGFGFPGSTVDYEAVVGEALAEVVGQTCDDIIIVN